MSDVALLLLAFYATVGLVWACAVVAVGFEMDKPRQEIAKRGVLGLFLWPVEVFLAWRSRRRRRASPVERTGEIVEGYDPLAPDDHVCR